jgi:hypothetical protein
MLEESGSAKWLGGVMCLMVAWAGVCALPATAGAEVCPNAAYRSGPSAGLPECRVYEAVSALGGEVGAGDVYLPDGPRNGESVATTLPFAVAPGGNAIAYAGDPAAEGSGSMGDGEGNTYVATRASGGGWSPVDEQPPGYLYSAYQAFSEDLSTGMLDSCSKIENIEGAASEALGGGYHVLYLHETGDRGLRGYRALVTEAMRPRERLPCKQGDFSFGFGFPEESAEPEPVLFAGANAGTSTVAAFSHVLFEANDGLGSAVPQAGPTGALENDLYESVERPGGSELRLVNVLPGQDRGEPDATFGSPQQTKGRPSDFSRVISAGGERVFWTDLKSHDLYVRENGVQTVQVDAAEAGCSSCESGGGWYWTASGDGQRAFFTDCVRLTAGSTAVPSADCGEQPGRAEGSGPLGDDLYEWDEGRLSDLTVDENAGEALGANVKGVIGASEDGEYVYFVAGGVLASAPNELGEYATPGDCAPSPPTSLCNLYVRHDGVTTFIAALSARDDFDGYGGGSGFSSGDWQPDLGHRTAEVTPDGRSVVFQSYRSLTGYDNVLDGVAVNEVYVYDAATARLSCASCNPSGAPPAVGKIVSEGGGEKGLVSFLPVSSGATYLQRWISDDGARVFFDTLEPLVSRDTNKATDVYEWERDGAGDCREEAGCVYLISGGPLTYTQSTENVPSVLIGTSASGEDVFFVSRARLVPQDHGELFVVYDARVDGVQPPSPPICTGSGCQGAPSAPPLFEAPPSATFSGIGNLEPPTPKPTAKALTRPQKLAKALKKCRKDKRKTKRLTCKKRAHRKYGPVNSNAKKSTANHRKKHV